MGDEPPDRVVEFDHHRGIDRHDVIEPVALLVGKRIPGRNDLGPLRQRHGLIEQAEFPLPFEPPLA